MKCLTNVWRTCRNRQQEHPKPTTDSKRQEQAQKTWIMAGSDHTILRYSSMILHFTLCDHRARKSGLDSSEDWPHYKIGSMSHHKTPSRRRLFKIAYDAQICLRRTNRGKIWLRSSEPAIRERGPTGG